MNMYFKCKKCDNWSKGATKDEMFQFAREAFKKYKIQIGKKNFTLCPTCGESTERGHFASFSKDEVHELNVVGKVLYTRK